MTSNRPNSLRTWLPIATWLAGKWRRFMQRWAEAQRNRHDVKVLSALDNHELKDIGLTRGDIELIVVGRSPQRRAHPRAPHRFPKTPATQSSRCPS